jgi:excisionase family DNA binding protein
MDLPTHLKGRGIAQVCVALGIGRTSIYSLIKSGQLRAVKIGRRTIVLSEDLDRYLAGLRAVIEPNARQGDLFGPPAKVNPPAAGMTALNRRWQSSRQHITSDHDPIKHAKR